MSKIILPNLLRALFICVNLNHDIDFNELVSEGEALANSAGYQILSSIIVKRSKIDGKFFIGKGKVEEIKKLCVAKNIGTVIINHNLSAVQERNLSATLQVPVIDRTRLILDIFATKATTNEGVLQVELASQLYQLTRLVRRWSHLERQKGGIGLRGGPGETQMELDRRMIADKIKSLKVRLTEAVKQRQVQRRARLKNDIFSISLVGYTNAGKSTLFNALTKAQVYAANRLFATVQTTSRKLFLENDSIVVLSDTVGFIRQLPHSLVAAFRATLEETIHANLLMHVVDIGQVLKDRQIEDVNIVLKEIKAQQIPQLIVYNKIDLKPGVSPRIDYENNGEPRAVYLSAWQNLGLDLLKQAIREKMSWIINNNYTQQELDYEPWKH